MIDIPSEAFGTAYLQTAKRPLRTWNSGLPPTCSPAGLIVQYCRHRHFQYAQIITDDFSDGEDHFVRVAGLHALTVDIEPKVKILRIGNVVSGY